MAVGALLCEQRLRRCLNVLVESAVQRRSRYGLLGVLGASFDACRRSWQFAITSAARLPDRIAPSMVAGRPVSVQSPARTRLLHWVAGAGTLCVLRRRRGERCAPLAHDLPRGHHRQFGGSSDGSPVTRATSLQIVLASSSRGESMSRSPALMVTDSRPGNAKIHCTVALSTPRIGGCCRRRIDAEMRVDDGAELGRHVEPGHQRRGGVGRHREDDRIIVAQERRSPCRSRALRPVRRQSASARS